MTLGLAGAKGTQIASDAVRRRLRKKATEKLLKPKTKPKLDLDTPKGLGKLTGFSKAEQNMLKHAEKTLSEAGYDVSKFKELIKADMPPGYRGMSLDNGAALGKEAFSSQSMLNHVLEEELLHVMQKAGGLGNQFSPATAKALEEAADAIRQFPFPGQ